MINEADQAREHETAPVRASQSFCGSIRAVDFFCGAGGMTHGLLSAGFDVLGGIDNHLPCKETYEHPENNVRPTGEAVRFVQADLSALNPRDLEAKFEIGSNDDALVFAGCSPCQYWSKVNTSRQRSTAGKALLEDFRRFVDAFRPGYVVIENVPGLRTNGTRSGLISFLDFLEGAGYAYDHDAVSVCFYGVPQKRSRYLLVATRVCRTGTEPSIALPAPEMAEGSFPEGMKLKYHIGEENGFKALCAGSRCEDPPLHWAASLSERNLRRISKTPRNGGSRDAWKDDSDLQIEAYRGRDNIFRDVYGRMSWDEPAPTITTRFNSFSNGRFGHPNEDRAISLREGAVLQTFPLKHVFPRNFPEAARQIGNAVPPELARRMGCRIFEHYRSVRDEEARG